MTNQTKAILITIGVILSAPTLLILTCLLPYTFMTIFAIITMGLICLLIKEMYLGILEILKNK